MKLRNYLLLFVFLMIGQNIKAQINSLDDFIVKTEELRMLTQRVPKNYIMSSITSKEKYAKKLEADKVKFNEILLMLTEKAPTDEIQIELQKLSLSWMLMNSIIKKKYDALVGSKLIDYAEKMEKEVETISDMVSKFSKQKSVKLLRVSSTGRMLSQKILLYYLANKLKIRNKEIPVRFDKAKEDMYNVVSLLTDYANNDPDLKADEGVAMYMDMIKDGFDKMRKGMTLKAKVHAVTASMLTKQMTDNFDVLTNMIYERFND